MSELTQYLASRTYPGRGIAIGLSNDKENTVIVYFIMGRSENSRNRVFEKTPDGIRTRPFDPAKLIDPSLIIYHPVREYEDKLIVTNGDQTDTVYAHLQQGLSFHDALLTRTYEPDAPNYTPRISALLQMDSCFPRCELSILRKPQNSTRCERAFFHYETFLPGVGHILHTYQNDGDPLPSFAHDPVCVTLPAGNIDACTEEIWSALHTENRVALYVCCWHMPSGEKTMRIINRHQGIL